MELNNNFPRELTKIEKELLFSVLPENKSGYNSYRGKIKNLLVIGYGRFGGSNLILGKEGTLPDNSLPSAPVFALGTIIYEDNQADIIIHEEIDDEIEFDISFNNPQIENLKEIQRWNYSEWNPGDKAPDDNAEIKEIEIVKDKYILAFAASHKKIWMHIIETGVNLLIPVTNYFNNLMIVKNIRSAEKVFHPSLLFSELHTYNDNELRSAFIAYNKYFKKINIAFPNPESQERKKNKKLFGLFKRG